MFDCGEGSQIQAQKCSNVRPGKISKVFITHLHGDHVSMQMNEQILSLLHQKVSTVCEYNHSCPFQLYGLPGVLSTFNQTLDPESQKRKRIDIYGPRGLRTYLRTILHLSKSDIGFKFAVHELIPTKKQCPKNWKVLVSLYGDETR